MSPLSRRRWLRDIAAQTAFCGLLGCGTVLHPERRGQPAGPLDWKVVALDGIGLLLFFVPGVIAFAVDFSTGAIYLPEGGYSAKQTSPRRPLVRRIIGLDELTAASIERLIADETGQSICLTETRYQTEQLADLENFWPAVRRLEDA